MQRASFVSLFNEDVTNFEVADRQISLLQSVGWVTLGEHFSNRKALSKGLHCSVESRCLRRISPIFMWQIIGWRCHCALPIALRRDESIVLVQIEADSNTVKRGDAALSAAIT